MYCLLDRYIGRTVLYNIFTVLLILISLSSVVKFFDELRKIGQGNYGALEAFFYVFLNIFKDIELFLPMAILLGTLLGLGVLLARNELIVMEIFGFSRLQILFSLVKIVCPVILFGIVINEWGSPLSERIARNYRYKMINNVSMYSRYNNLWIKDGCNFIYIERVLQDYYEVFGIHIYHFDANAKRYLKGLRYAAYGKFINNSWDLLDVRELYFSNSTKIVEKKYINDVWRTTLTPHDLSIVVMSVYHSSALSVFDLYHCIQYFTKTGQSTAQYQLFFWRKIFFPFSSIVMILISLSYILKSLLYKLHISVQVLIGVTYSFFFIF